MLMTHQQKIAGNALSMTLCSVSNAFDLTSRISPMQSDDDTGSSVLGYCPKHPIDSALVLPNRTIVFKQGVLD